jgi:hypothetical protein
MQSACDIGHTGTGPGTGPGYHYNGLWTYALNARATNSSLVLTHSRSPARAPWSTAGHHRLSAAPRAYRPKPQMDQARAALPRESSTECMLAACCLGAATIAPRSVMHVRRALLVVSQFSVSSWSGRLVTSVRRAAAGRGEGGERTRYPAVRSRTDHPRVAGVERHV